MVELQATGALAAGSVAGAGEVALEPGVGGVGVGGGAAGVVAAAAVKVVAVLEGVTEVAARWVALPEAGERKAGRKDRRVLALRPSVL